MTVFWWMRKKKTSTFILKSPYDYICGKFIMIKNFLFFAGCLFLVLKHGFIVLVEEINFLYLINGVVFHLVYIVKQSDVFRCHTTRVVVNYPHKQRVL